MDMMEFLLTRRTYRRFDQRPIAPEILTEAIDAARLASCGANRQTVRYILVQNARAVSAVQPLVHWAAYLPPEQGVPKPDEQPTAFIAVLQDTRLPGCSDVDVGLALGSLTAAAWAHGVGSCIMGAIDRPALTELLALPDGVRDDDVRAERDADEKVDDEADDRAVCAHRRDGDCARIAREVADDGNVRGVEELLQDRRGRDRQGKERQLIPDGAVQHVDLMLFDCSSHDLSHFFLFSA